MSMICRDMNNNHLSPRYDRTYLNSITYADTQTYIPPVYFCKVVKVYDGDTITVATKLYTADSPVYRFSVRLAGIDTPEIHGSTSSEKASAIVVRDLLANLVLNKIVLLKNVHFEKYGRLLADVYLGDLHVNKHLLDTHCAVPYHGGKKEKFVNILRNDV